MAYINDYLQYDDDEILSVGYTLCRDCAKGFDDLFFEMASEDDNECEICGATNDDEPLN